MPTQLILRMLFRSILTLTFIFCSLFSYAQCSDPIEKWYPTPVVGGVGGYGRVVALCGNTALIGAPGSDSLDVSAGIVYIYEFKNGQWSESARLSPSDPTAFLQFGYSADMSEDRIAIGVPSYSQDKSNEGAVYVYEKGSDGVWNTSTEDYKIVSPLLEENHGFGYKVSLLDDLLLIGGFRNAYLFKKESNDFSKIASLSPSNKPAYTRLGAVKITSNLIAIGDLEDVGENSIGSVFLFEKPLSGWQDINQKAKLSASSKEYCQFGEAISIAGDEILVGAPWLVRGVNGPVGGAFLFKKPSTGWVSKTEDAQLFGSSSQGWEIGKSLLLTDTHAFIKSTIGKNTSLLIFEKKGGGWTEATEDQTLSLPAAEDNMDFGFSISAGVDRLLIGCPVTFNQGGQGRAYIYDKPANGWSDLSLPTHMLSDVDSSATNALFGYEIATDGRYTVVGAPKDNNKGVRQGAVYVYGLENNRWKKLAKLKASDSQPGDDFGKSVAIKGEYIIVGSMHADSIKADGSVALYSTGATYVYKKPAGEWKDSYQTQKISSPTPLSYENFGRAVAIDENFAVVTSYNTSEANTWHQGKAYVYKNNGSTWNYIATLTTAGNTTDDEFGRSMAMDGNTIVIGSGKVGFGIPKQSFAYVYSKPVGNWKNAAQTAILRPKNHQVGSLFGYSVDINQDQIIVGEPLFTGSATRSGCAYIFTKPATGWTDMVETSKLTASRDIANSAMGFTVAIQGNKAIVGAPESETGKVYIFNKATNGWQDTDESGFIAGEVKDFQDFFGSYIALSENHLFIGSVYDSYGHHKRAGSVYPYAIHLPFITSSIDTICLQDEPIQLKALPAGGRWYGTGIIDENSGLFDPATAKAGSHKIIYQTNDCQTSITIQVRQEIELILPKGAVCVNKASFLLEASPRNGIWTGKGVVSPTTGEFDPALAGVGKHKISYQVNGCRKESYVEVIRDEVPTFSILTQQAILCGAKESLLSSDVTGEYTYQWLYSSTGTNFNATEANHTTLYKAKTTGYYILDISSGCSKKRDTVYVELIEMPKVEVSTQFSKRNCMVDEISLVNSYEKDVVYEWNYAKDLTQQFEVAKGDYSNNYYTPTISGVYRLKASRKNCITFSQAIEIDIAPVKDIYIPNVITPNGDEKNDQWVLLHVQGQAHVTIYNRWGKKVFSSTDYRNDWKGEGLQGGMYFYTVESKTNCFGSKKGWVQLLK